MTTSSVQAGYLTTSSDTITITSSCHTTGSSYYYTGGGIGGAGSGNITISTGATGSSVYSGNTISIAPLTTSQISGLTVGGTITTGSYNNSAFTFQIPSDWESCFPDWNKVQKMCEEYPGLKIAFEKFKTTYKLVVDHYDTPEDKRPKP